jgi:diguanylate cyclase (GGDEF)-like protein
VKRLVRRLAAVLDITDTADAARLGSVFLAFEGLVLATTGWWLHARDGAAGWPLTIGASMVAASVASSRLPWARWPRRSVAALPLVAICLLACLAVGAPRTAPPYVGLLALWFVFAGLAAPSGTALTLLLPSVSVYLLMLGVLDARHLVRGVLAGCTWVLLGEAMATRAAFSSCSTADLVRQTETDPLTGVRNRRALDAALSTVAAGDVLVVIDLDHFKSVNDRHGHAYGDTVLVDFARTLVDVVRASDVVARLGGEEFVLILRHGAVDSPAPAVVHRLRQSWQRVHADVTWSAGVAAQEPGGHPHETLHRADRDLYAAKAAGRDRVVTATASAEPVGALPSPQRATDSSRKTCATTTSG